jgi:hypothetical protein
MLLLAIGVLFFILQNRQRLRSVPHSGILILGFFMILGAWIFTVIEGFLLEALFNFLEHMCYAASSLLMALWIWKVFGSRKDTR